MFKQALSLAVLSAVTSIASIGYAGSAHALGFSYSAGSYRQPTVTDQGAFSNNVNNTNYETFDFNSGTVPGNEKVTYSFSQGNYSTTADSGQTGIYNDVWAPAGVAGEVNTSKYLAVFQGNDTIIEAATGVFNYFGFDAGALSVGNTIKFFNGSTLVRELNYDLMTALAPISASQHGGQQNGFFEFFSEGSNDNFNKIVLTQADGGGFESDNHTFRMGSGAYAAVPEPGVVLGLFGIGGMFLRKRKSQKIA
jgi:PEP-CTERM motif